MPDLGSLFSENHPLRTDIDNIQWELWRKVSGLNAIIGSDHLVKDIAVNWVAPLEKRIEFLRGVKPVAEYAAFYGRLFSFIRSAGEMAQIRLECIQFKRGALNQFSYCHFHRPHGS